LGFADLNLKSERGKPGLASFRFQVQIWDAVGELGFALEPVRASLEFLIIEHVEKPSEN
jgi:hypothetical protein